jgi:DNA-binding NtrC family response regulator
LFENELFGHKKGAYTHASSSEIGLINSANHGTLFLDEIESLPKHSQVKLLRFLEEKKYRPLGQTNLYHSDARIIFASNSNLSDLVESGKFRADLFYRVSVVNIFLTPLTKRREDIPLLAQHFIEKYSKLYGKKILGLRPDAILAMVNYSWPGNVRELQNVLQETIVLSNDQWIEKQQLKFKSRRSDSYIFSNFHDAKELIINNFEKDYLSYMLKTFQGNVTKASLFAGKDRREFYRLVRKHNINLDQFR